MKILRHEMTITNKITTLLTRFPRTVETFQQSRNTNSAKSNAAESNLRVAIVFLELKKPQKYNSM